MDGVRTDMDAAMDSALPGEMTAIEIAAPGGPEVALGQPLGARNITRVVGREVRGTARGHEASKKHPSSQHRRGAPLVDR